MPPVETILELLAQAKQRPAQLAADLGISLVELAKIACGPDSMTSIRSIAQLAKVHRHMVLDRMRLRAIERLAEIVETDPTQIESMVHARSLATIRAACANILRAAGDDPALTVPPRGRDSVELERNRRLEEQKRTGDPWADFREVQRVSAFLDVLGLENAADVMEEAERIVKAKAAAGECPPLPPLPPEDKGEDDDEDDLSDDEWDDPGNGGDGGGSSGGGGMGGSGDSGGSGAFKPPKWPASHWRGSPWDRWRREARWEREQTRQSDSQPEAPGSDPAGTPGRSPAHAPATAPLPAPSSPPSPSTSPQAPTIVPSGPSKRAFRSYLSCRPGAVCHLHGGKSGGRGKAGRGARMTHRRCNTRASPSLFRGSTPCRRAHRQVGIRAGPRWSTLSAALALSPNSNPA